MSHSWSPPENWHLLFGRLTSYATLKSTMLAVVAKDVVLSRGDELKSWKDVTFWVDKACTPHFKSPSTGCVERCISRCDRVCILLTWCYLQRLRCVCEFACVLASRGPGQIWLHNEMFVTEQSLPLYLECIRYFSLQRAQCCDDREEFEAKIGERYASRGAFEALVRAAATALMARSMAFRAGRSAALRIAFFDPWVDLAEDLGLAGLAAALRTCRPGEWREAAALADGPQGIATSTYHVAIEDWFERHVTPVLLAMFQEAVKGRLELRQASSCSFRRDDNRP